MSNSDQKETKLAPIFDFKTNKSTDKVTDIKGLNKLKRKKKSTKGENKKKSIKKFDNNCVERDSIDCRRSQRLKHKESTNGVKHTYNEDLEEEICCDKSDDNFVENENKFNDSVVLIEENSNTIDYWTDSNGINCGQQSEDSEDTDVDIEVIPFENVPKVVTQESTEEQKKRLLWTEKYKPINSSEVIGDKVAVNRLKSWLEDWNKSDSNRCQLYREDNSDTEDNGLDESNSCLLICGPTGSGKTSMVYAIAEELKYEILELNASMKRNGRIISRILSEATQSHQMQRNSDPMGSTNNTIHSFFTSVAKTNINTVSNDINAEEGVKRKKKSKPKGILNYFTKQTNNLVNNCEEIEISESKEITDKTKISVKSESVLKTNEKLSNDLTLFSPKVLSIATNSLILFDDIDVLFDDNFSGFWSAFNKINAMTKKPVILTATQFIPYIKDCVNHLKVLSLNKPNDCQTIEVLKSICDKELDDSRQESSDSLCQYLSNTYDNDIRRCINELQFGCNDWPQFEEFDTKPVELIDEKTNTISYYNSIQFMDLMQTNFNVLSNSENRDLWMNCRPTAIENETKSIVLAKDILNSVNELNNKINKCLNPFKSKDLESPIDCESIDNICRFLTPNTTLRTILLDYCPYISLICNSESIRQSEIANHSRRSRRFMHHLDSIGLYIDDTIKTKLISVFIDESNSVSEEIPKQESKISSIIDEDFYD